ncbi:MAG: glycogen synthase GlgA [Planctomycetota bacterium]|jgi:starch synthase|nr:glycogen synthase GlgA [Planctomycetota bacterium]
MASKKEHQRKRKVRERSWNSRETGKSAAPPGEVLNSLDILSSASSAPDNRDPGEADAPGHSWLLEVNGPETAQARERARRLAEEAERGIRLAEEARRRNEEIEAERTTAERESREREREEGERARRLAEETERENRLAEEARRRNEEIEAERTVAEKKIPEPWWGGMAGLPGRSEAAGTGEPPAEAGDSERGMEKCRDESLPVTLATAGDSGTAARGSEFSGVRPEAGEENMYIVMVTPEVAPCAKVGGLGDVILGLGRELIRRGHEVEVVCPMYSCMRYDEINGLREEFGELWCPYGGGWRSEKVFQGTVGGGLKVNFITGGGFTERNSIYGHPDDLDRFAYFSRQALEFMFKSGRRPDIIHCHDWATGLVPVVYWEIYQKLGWNNARLVYTIHNNESQGLCGYPDRLLGAIGLDAKSCLRPDRLQDDRHRNCLNMMKGGIVFSNFVTAVSPSYAGELRTAAGGGGLEQVLNRHHGKFGGILNGIDYEAWNPDSDPKLAVRYSAGDDFFGKYGNKKALRDWLGLREDWRPVVSVVSRLTRQKGLDLIKHAVFTAIKTQGQFVLLGSAPDPGIEADFRRLQNDLRNNPDVKFYLGYHEDLSHLIYAGSDIFLVPSIYEPCGLTQMISLRYGTVPVVRETGGLNDSVFDVDTSGRGREGANGFTFRDPTPASLDYGLNRAIRMWFDRPDTFNRLARNGMACDYSWREPARHYENIYKFIQS